MKREALVAHARESIARGSKSFRAASRLFDRQTRERAWLLYAWCRACDDIADGQDHGGTMSATGDPQARLAEIQTLTDARCSASVRCHPPSKGSRSSPTNVASRAATWTI
jgi:phytoene synthase